MRPALLLAALSILPAASACAAGGDPASLVKGLRVLAIRAEPPQLTPGGQSALTALVHPEGGVDFTWTVCLASDGSTSGFECASSELECSLGAEATATLDLVAGLKECAGAAAVADGLTDEELSSGVTVYIRLVATAAGDSIEAIKSVHIQAEPPFNNNPALAEVTLNGEPWLPDEKVVVLPGERVKLVPAVSEGSRESFLRADGGGESSLVLEEMTYAWFATAGDMDDTFTNDAFPDNRWKAPGLGKDEAEREVTFWVVVRDGRGGTGWLQRRLLVLKETAPP